MIDTFLSPDAHFKAILKTAAANHNAKDYKRHYLMHGDYYPVEFGNVLLKIGLAW